MDIRTKRVYERPDSHDGVRVLVDRVLPRGMRKERAQANHWLKDVAPSTALRRWFGHDPSKWEESKARYFKGLDTASEEVARLLEAATERPLTLLYYARDVEHNQAVDLREYLLSLLGKDRPS